jgi:hypothetical protein
VGLPESGPAAARPSSQGALGPDTEQTDSTNRETPRRSSGGDSALRLNRGSVDDHSRATPNRSWTRLPSPDTWRPFQAPTFAAGRLRQAKAEACETTPGSTGQAGSGAGKRTAWSATPMSLVSDEPTDARGDLGYEGAHARMGVHAVERKELEKEQATPGSRGGADRAEGCHAVGGLARGTASGGDPATRQGIRGPTRIDRRKSRRPMA